MIRKYTHKNIDKIKYTQCLSESLNYRIYAELWYLDIVSPDGYDILVLHDYEAIMPIPTQKKLGFIFASQPVFCQQLGIFYKEEISNENFHLFFSLLKKYRVRNYCFNEENTHYFSSSKETKDNQVLYLKNTYSEIHQNYHKGRKKTLKYGKFDIISIDKIYISEDLNVLYKNGHLNYLKKSDFNVMKKLYDVANKKNKIQQYSLLNQEKKKTIFVWVLSDNNRLIISTIARIKKTELRDSLSYLLDIIIKKHSQSNKILDFEGSMIPGVANFNKSFGAITKNYVIYQNFKWFERIKKWLGQ